MTDELEHLKAALADRYAIKGALGSGGMATVYLAEDLKHERLVAVKVLRPELAAVLGADRFLQEIKITANLNHPHILPLLDSGTAGPADRPTAFMYYVMPYVEGETLHDQLQRERQLSVEDAVRITSEVASALDYAHRHDIIHRDIKPGNILLHDGKALVADFGIALAVTVAGGSRITETGLSLGTPEYMSPEQATGDRQIDARSDVYSLGAVLYELLTGEPPHTGPTVQAVISRVVTEDVEPVTTRRTTVPVNVDAALRKALAKLPADRFATAALFAEALSDSTFALPAAAGVGSAPTLERFWKRLAIGATGFAALLAILAAVALRGWLKPVEKPVIRASLAWSDEMVTGAEPFFSLSSDGSVMAFVGRGERNHQLWIRALDALQARVLPGTDGAVAPFFSPDGNSVAFIVRDAGDLKVVDIDGGTPRTVAQGAARTLGGDWGPDGMLYFEGLDGGIWRVPAEGGTAESVTLPDSSRGELSHHFVDVLPNGDAAIVTIWRGSAASSDIGILSFETRDLRVLVQGCYARYAPPGHLVFVRSDGTLLAAPFDPTSLELNGSPAVLADGVAVATFEGYGNLALSENGTLMYRRDSDVRHQVVWVEPRGVVTPVDSLWRGNFYSLRLSPDGTRLAVATSEPGRNHIWVKQLDRGPLTRLTFEGSVNYRPEWTADGQSLTFISDRVGGTTLWMKRADGSAPAELLLDHDHTIDQGFVSRDGQWLVFRTGNTGFRTRDLYAIRPGVDSIPRTLVASEADEYSPALSPDGRWLAYVSNESGGQEVYVRPFPETGGGKWQVSVNGGRGPVWSHGGRRLYYQTDGGDVAVMDVVTEPTFSAGEPRVVVLGEGYARHYFHPMFDVAPDDQRIVMIQDLGGQGGELILVLNWFEELKERLGD